MLDVTLAITRNFSQSDQYRKTHILEDHFFAPTPVDKKDRTLGTFLLIAPQLNIFVHKLDFWRAIYASVKVDTVAWRFMAEVQRIHDSIFYDKMTVSWTRFIYFELFTFLLLLG